MNERAYFELGGKREQHGGGGRHTRYQGHQNYGRDAAPDDRCQSVGCAVQLWVVRMHAPRVHPACPG